MCTYNVGGQFQGEFIKQKPMVFNTKPDIICCIHTQICMYTTSVFVCVCVCWVRVGSKDFCSCAWYTYTSSFIGQWVPTKERVAFFPPLFCCYCCCYDDCVCSSSFLVVAALVPNFQVDSWFLTSSRSSEHEIWANPTSSPPQKKRVGGLQANVAWRQLSLWFLSPLSNSFSKN